MKPIDPRAFGHKSAGDFLRETIARRRREARTAALTGAGAALLFSVATGVAMALGREGLAAPRRRRRRADSSFWRSMPPRRLCHALAGRRVTWRPA
jgi:hypothetical protein